MDLAGSHFRVASFLILEDYIHLLYTVYCMVYTHFAAKRLKNLIVLYKQIVLEVKPCGCQSEICEFLHLKWTHSYFGKWWNILVNKGHRWHVKLSHKITQTRL